MYVQKWRIFNGKNFKDETSKSSHLLFLITESIEIMNKKYAFNHIQIAIPNVLRNEKRAYFDF